MEPLIMHPSFHAFYLSNQNVARKCTDLDTRKKHAIYTQKNDKKNKIKPQPSTFHRTLAETFQMYKLLV
jgi:hypothetical protein